jgi:predicted transcriptional regulator of viral defense system
VTDLDSKFAKLSEIVDKTIFTADEAARALDVKKSSAYWILHNLVKRRHLNRVSRGYYAVVPSSPVAVSAPSLSRLAAQIVANLHCEGIRFYVTGLDILTSFFDQVPASFPPLIYVEAGSADWASRSALLSVWPSGVGLLTKSDSP